MDLISTLPDWAINSLALGLIGGSAGLLGWLLTKAGIAWGKFVPVIVIALGFALVGNGRLTDWVRSSTLTPERAGLMLKQINPELFGVLETNFPSDFKMLSAKVANLVNAGGSNASSIDGAAAMAEIRRKYAPMVALADDTWQTALVDSNIDLYEALLAADPMLCTSVAIEGPAILLEQPGTEKLQAMFNPQAVMVLQAAAAAIKSPVQRKTATDADWNALWLSMAERGATEAQLNAINSRDPSSPELCPGMLVLLHTLNDVDTEAIKSVRAQYLESVAGA